MRPITVLGLSLYDQELNKKWERDGNSNTPLGIIHDVNFKIKDVNITLEHGINLMKKGF